MNIIHYDNGISSNLLRVSGKIIPWVQSRCIKMQTNSDLASLAPQGRRDESIKRIFGCKMLRYFSLIKDFFIIRAGGVNLTG